MYQQKSPFVFITESVELGQALNSVHNIIGFCTQWTQMVSGHDSHLPVSNRTNIWILDCYECLVNIWDQIMVFDVSADVIY